jgi:hypothetical protein
VNGDAVIAKVVLGGTLLSNKGVNLPGAELGIPSFTEKDQADLQFGLKAGVDMVAISFVHNANDIQVVRQAIKDMAPERAKLPIIASWSVPKRLKTCTKSSMLRMASWWPAAIWALKLLPLLYRSFRSELSIWPTGMPNW